MIDRKIVRGWLLELYAAPGDGLTVWIIEDAPDNQDGPGDAAHPPARRRLRQPFPVAFYAAGPHERLRQLWRYLQNQSVPVRLERVQSRDLFQPPPLITLAIQVEDPARQPALFGRVAAAFPDLTYYNADIPLALRHAARYGSFPLAHVQVTLDREGAIETFESLDAPWELDPPPPPLRTLRIEPDCDPHHAPPCCLKIQAGGQRYTLSLARPRPLLINLQAILKRHDPDLIVSNWGDTWLFPLLLQACQKEEISFFNPNRD